VFNMAIPVKTSIMTAACIARGDAHFQDIQPLHGPLQFLQMVC
jgi:hypothetical protein